MNNLVLTIVQLVLSLVQAQGNGEIQQDAVLANIVLQIVQKGYQAYAQYAGKPLDPSLLKIEDPI
jgi:hypothetical protein